MPLKQHFYRFFGTLLLLSLTLLFSTCDDDDSNAALTANFVADVTTVPAGGVVTFTNATVGVPDLISWNFEGGTPPTFNGEEARITYSTPGKYDVTLTAFNAINTSTETKEEYITVTFVADFLADNTTIKAGETVFFSDQTNGDPIGWDWRFEGGEPASSDQQDNTVTYQALGTYDVILTVTDADGNTSTETKTDYITVE
jgi:PKD repeat protein